MPYVGIISLYFACALTILSIVTGLIAIRRKSEAVAQIARRVNFISTVMIGSATISLIIAFVSNDFRLAYVARNSARNLPLIYKISALWAGQSGSLLLWLFVIALLGLAVQMMKEYRKQYLDIQLGMVIYSVRLLFTGLLLFVTPPFELLANPPFNGSGLNPMLQSLGMVFHPPLLFLGFGGFLVPFALAVIGLWTKDEDGVCLERIRPWVLFAWVFLTAGIITGGHWAYTELGWGGYWAWDPVENASLFPWLTGTALLHLLLLPKQYGSKRLWSFILIVATYSLTIFGTFLTRSGILDSVHAFSGGVLGQVFLGVLMGILFFSLGLGFSRRRFLLEPRGNPEDQSLLSTETNTIFGIILFLVICVGVFFGTMFPVFSRLFRGREVVLDASFFNQLTVPLFLTVIFLMGLSPLFRTKELTLKAFLKRLWLPLLGALGMGVYTWFQMGGGLAASISFALVVFGFCTHVPSFISPRSRRSWGGTLVHLGLLVLVMGVTGSSVYKDDVFVAVQPGQQISLGDYVLEYNGLQTRYGSDRYTVGTTLDVSKGGKKRGEITSEKTFWDNRNQPSTQIGIYRTYKEDLYVNLAGWENPTSQLHIQRFALIRWIWVGAWMMCSGAVVILLGNTAFVVKGRQVKPWSSKTS